MAQDKILCNDSTYKYIVFIPSIFFSFISLIGLVLVLIEANKKTRKKSNKYQYSVDISTALKLSRKYFIRKESDKKMDIIGLIAKHVHAVKTEFRQFDRPLRGIGAIHFGYR